jgi:hypothetical protein
MIFAVDDSEIEIEGRLHTILAAVCFERPDETRTQIRNIKARFGMRNEEEIKWNGTELESQQQREAMSEELLGILSQSKFFVTVCEGVDRQLALEHLAIQLDDFLQARSKYADESSTVQLICDNGIIKNGSEFDRYLKQTNRERLVLMD